MLALMERFSAMFGLDLAPDVFRVAEQLSHALKSKGVYVQQSFAVANRTMAMCSDRPYADGGGVRRICLDISECCRG